MNRDDLQDAFLIIAATNQAKRQCASIRECEQPTINKSSGSTGFKQFYRPGFISKRAS